MHAVILSGGEGQRLRPLTCTQPKPLMPVLGKPVIAYAVQLAVRHGAHDICATVSYQGEKIEAALGDGAEWGVNMRYLREKTPLGTAGSVREAAKMLRETFFVLSGDALTDCDLTRALAFHREKGALATLVLKACAHPEAFGVVVTGADGRIETFVEKPERTQAPGKCVNTGLYILEPEILRFIPQGRAVDFGRELFPRLVAQGLPVYGYEMQGYWRDIGDVEGYVAACADALDGRVRLDAPWEADECGNRIAPDAKVSDFATVIAPCFVGSGAQLAPGAVVGPHAVIEAQARVRRDAHVKRSVLLSGARVGMGTRVSGAVMAREAQTEAACAIWEGCVLGEQAVMEEEASLSRGARVWPQKRIEAGRRVTQDVVWGDCRRVRVREGVMTCETLAETMDGARAWAQVSGAKRAALMHAGGKQAKLRLRGAAAQLSACGVEWCELGGGSEPMLAVQARLLGAQMAIFFDKRRMVLLDAQQCAPSRAQQRMMEWGHGEKGEESGAGTGRRVHGAQQYYLAHLCRAADGEALREMQPYGVIACPKKAQEKTVRALLAQLGLENMRVCRGKQAQVRSYETGFFLSEDGKSVRIADSRGLFSAPQTELLDVLALASVGEREILLPGDAPMAARTLCREERVDFRCVPGERRDWARELAKYPAQQDFYGDGLYAMVTLLTCFVRSRTMARALLEKHVQSAFCEQEVPCAHARAARVLDALSREWGTPWTHGAMQTAVQNGHATLCAGGNGASVRILTQSRDTETARELCADLAEKVRGKMAQMDAEDARTREEEKGND